MQFPSVRIAAHCCRSNAAQHPVVWARSCTLQPLGRLRPRGKPTMQTTAPEPPGRTHLTRRPLPGLGATFRGPAKHSSESPEQLLIGIPHCSNTPSRAGDADALRVSERRSGRVEYMPSCWLSHAHSLAGATEPKKVVGVQVLLRTGVAESGRKSVLDPRLQVDLLSGHLGNQKSEMRLETGSNPIFHHLESNRGIGGARRG